MLEKMSKDVGREVTYLELQELLDYSDSWVKKHLPSNEALANPESGDNILVDSVAVGLFHLVTGLSLDKFLVEEETERNI